MFISDTTGGLQMYGINESTAADSPLKFYGVHGSSNPTDSIGAIVLNASRSDGSTGNTNMGLGETLLDVKNYDTSRFTISGMGELGITSKDYTPSEATRKTKVFYHTKDITDNNYILLPIPTTFGNLEITGKETSGGALVYGKYRVNSDTTSTQISAPVGNLEYNATLGSCTDGKVCVSYSGGNIFIKNLINGGVTLIIDYVHD